MWNIKINVVVPKSALREHLKIYHNGQPDIVIVGNGGVEFASNPCDHFCATSKYFSNILVLNLTSHTYIHIHTHTHKQTCIGNGNF